MQPQPTSNKQQSPPRGNFGGIKNNKLLFSGIILLGIIPLVLSFAGPSILRFSMGCRIPNPTIISQIKNKARSNYLAGESRISHSVFKEAATFAIPPNEQKFGMVSVLVVHSAQFFANPVSETLSGVYRNDYFVISEHGTIHPLTELAAAGYDFPVPNNDGWAEWAAKIKGSTGAVGCAG